MDTVLALVRNLGVITAPVSLTSNGHQGLILPSYLPAQALSPSHFSLPGPRQQHQPRPCSLPPVRSPLCRQALSNMWSFLLPLLSVLQGRPPLTG